MSEIPHADSGTPHLEAAAAPRRRRPWWFRFLRAAAVTYVVWCGVLYLLQDHMLFHPEMARAVSERPFDPRTIVTRINPNTDHASESWLIPAPGVDEAHPGPIMVFEHGNAEIIDSQEATVRGYHAMGVSVLLSEFRGYGRTGGHPGEKGIVEDVVSFYDEMLASPMVDRQRIIIHGRSLGGGVAAQLAARRPSRALILESTFTSVAVMSHKYGAPSFIVTNPFRTDRVIDGFDFPVLIFHGTIDPVVPVEHGRSLRDLAKHATYVEYEKVGHELPGPEYWDDYWKQIHTFLLKTGVLISG